MPSPNIWRLPALYELENRAFDRDGVVARALEDLAPWAGLDVLDVGCGTGFHLPWFAREARQVVGLEPHPDLVALARRRTRRLANVVVEHGSVTAVPLPPASVDVVHVRWAYFFGPGCEPGLAELDRVVRRGGVATVLDNDATRSTFGRWFDRGYPHACVGPEVEAFWSSHGWTRVPLETAWTFDSRADLEQVVRMELPPAAAQEALAGHTGTVVDYAVNVFWKRFRGP